MFEIICLIIGAICFVWGLAAHVAALIIIGIIFLALGGVIFIFFDGDFGDMFD